MKIEVRVRKLEEAKAVPFTEVEGEKGLEELIAFINRSGGVVDDETGEHTPYLCYQLCLDETKVFAEIVLGVDED